MACDLPARNVQRWVKGDNAIPMDSIQLLCDRFDASAHWLLLGEGQMFRDSDGAEVSPINATPFAIYGTARALEPQLGEAVQRTIRVFLGGSELDKAKAAAFLQALDPGEKKAGLSSSDEAARLDRASRRRD